MPSCWTSSVPKLPVPELQIDEPHSHRPRNARRSINDPTEVDPEVPPPVSIPLAVLPPFFITPTQVPQNMPAFTPMVVPGTAPAAPAALGTGGTGAAAVIHLQIGNTAPEVPRHPRLFQRHAAPAVMDTGPWYSPPRLPPGPFAPGPVPPFAQQGTVPRMLLPSTQPGPVPPMPPPYTQSVILPPIFNDMMAMVRENRFMHLAALEQQRELMRYMNSLNEWLGNDVEDRQAELRGVSARIDQLREDVNSLGLTGLTRAFLPPPGSSLEPGGFIVSGGPGAPDAPGAPCSPGASIISVCPTSIFSRARRLFSSGTVLLGDLSVPQLSQISTPQPIQRYPI